MNYSFIMVLLRLFTCANVKNAREWNESSFVLLEWIHFVLSD